MGGTSSARPDNLKAFVDRATPATSDLVSAINRLRVSYDEFQVSGSIPVSNPELMDVALAELPLVQQNDDTFVTVTRQAFLTADGGAGSRTVTVSNAAFGAAFTQAARAAGVDPALLDAVGKAITVDPAMAGSIPHDSGYVDDPVCTATGHFTEVETDFVVPERLRALAWVRRYSSRLLDDSGHGRGWWTWASTRLVPETAAAVRFRGPDGRLAVFFADAAGGWGRVPGVEATLERVEGSLVLRWDASSEWPLQVWTFGPDGHIDAVDGPTVGTTTFAYEDERLVRLDHEGGRSLAVEWDAGRIVATRLSDGRRVTYTYGDGDDLAAVDSAAGARSYDVDGDGRIVAVHDADGVRLCHNTYDPEGRVTRQVSPLGRETILEYTPGRRTVVRDSADGPVALFAHDEIGRVVSVTTGEGATYSRAFGPDGRLVQEQSFDGTVTEYVRDGTGTTVVASGPSPQTWRYDSEERVVAHERPGGRVTRFSYDGSSPLPLRVEDPEGGVRRFEYAAGLVSATVDGDGVRMDFDTDGDGCVVAARDILGRETRFERHPSGLIARMVHPDGTAVSLDRDDAGRLLLLTDEEGGRLVFEYSAAGRLVGTVGPTGDRTTLEHDASGEVVRVVDARGGAVEFRYDLLGNLAGMTNADGSKWEYAHTLMGQLSMVAAPDGGVWSYGYDVEGRQTSMAEPSGRTRRWRYTDGGLIAGTTDLAGAAATVERDEAGNPVSLRDTLGASITLGWDLADRLVEVVDADGVRDTRRYSPAGRLLSRAVGSATRTLGYDDAGRLTGVRLGDGGEWSYSYDARDRVVEAVSPEGRRSRVSYDRCGRPTAVSVDGLTWRTAYDAAGRILSRTTPGGATTRFEYDDAGHGVAAVDPTGNRTAYGYDTVGNVIETLDALGGSVQRTYDPLRRLRSVTDALGRTTSFECDPSGRLTARVEPGGDRVDYAYDEGGRLSDVLLDGVNAVVYDYDRAGRPTLVHEPAKDRTETFTWSPGGRLTSWSDEQRSLAWGWGDAGALESRTGPDGETLAYGYDSRGWLARVAGGRWGEVVLDHDEDGLLRSVVTPASARTWRYDGNGRLVGLDVTGPDGTVHTALTVDDDGRVVRVVEEAPGGTLAVADYRYDPAGRMVAARVERDGSAEESEWVYDAAGRPVRETTAGRTRVLSYDAAHQLSAVEGPDGRTAYTYDAAGRRKTAVGPDGERRWMWDRLGRPLGVVDPSGRVDLDVDASGHLVRAGSTALVWDPTSRAEQLVQLGDRAVLSVGGRVLATASGDDVEWLTTDWRGSVGGRDAWGRPEDSSGAPRLGFLGELEVSGLVWLRARLFDPATAQFLTPDPLPGAAGSAAGSFAYQYADDDPIGRVDPLGLKPLSMSDFNKIRAEGTGPQWGTIAAIGVGLGLGVLTVATMGADTPLLAIVAAGAGAGALSGATPGIVKGLRGDGWDPGAIFRGAVVGGIVGGVTGGIGKFLPEEGVSSLASNVGLGAGGGASGTLAQYGYDYTDLPGSTGKPSFSLGDLAFTTVSGGATSAATVGIHGLMPAHSTTTTDPISPVRLPEHPDTPAEPPSPVVLPKPGDLVVPVAPHLVTPGTPPGFTRTPSGVLVPSAPAPSAPPPGFTESPSGLLVPTRAG